MWPIGCVADWVLACRNVVVAGVRSVWAGAERLGDNV